jgi:hypothetical protein
MPRLLHIPASYYGVTTPLLLALWSDLWPNLLRLDRYISHGNDFLWGVDLVRLNFVANWLIVFSFLVIFLTFVFLIFKGRRNMARPWLFVAIGAFILASAGTNFMEAWALWAPQNQLAGAVKLVTAIASVIIASAFPPLVPRILSFINIARIPEERAHQLQTHAAALASINKLPEGEVAERKRAEAALLKAHNEALRLSEIRYHTLA